MIYIVGSGFSSLAAVLTFLKYDLDVTVLDVGKKNKNSILSVKKTQQKSNGERRLADFLMNRTAVQSRMRAVSLGEAVCSCVAYPA